MDMNQILELLRIIIMGVLGGLAFYFRSSAKAQRKLKEVQETIAKITAQAVVFIKEAEEDYKDVSNAGGQKFKEVVHKLHNLIPDGLDKIITEEMIGEIVQSTFDEIEAYMSTKLDEMIIVKESNHVED